MNTTASVTEVLGSTNPIANRVKTITTKPNRQLDSVTVDNLLTTYTELIQSNYTHWFAARFYNLPLDKIHQLASQAKADGSNPQRLFCHLVKKAQNG